VGDRFAFLAYEPTVNAVVTRRASAIAQEAVLTSHGRRDLLRVEISTDRIDAPGVSLQLPTTVVWLDEQYVVQRRQMEFEGLGSVIFLRSEASTARPAAVVEVQDVDIGKKSLIPLSRPVPRLHSASSALYRIVLEGEGDAAGAFVSDSHQTVRQQVGPALDLQVHPVRGPRRGGAEKAGPECLGSSYYLDSEDERIRETARRLAGRDSDPWTIALRIERWAHQAIRPDHAATMVPASQVLRSPRGDCRHYALLTAALCRAAGIPSRTALGLVYVERDQKPFLGFHMWTEVCIDGEWRGLDAALGRGGVGAGHLKVSDHTWHDTRSLTPLIPVQRILGKATVIVQRVEHGG
jgi:transglutaminase-like putative cysteine protease